MLRMLRVAGRRWGRVPWRSVLLVGALVAAAHGSEKLVLLDDQPSHLELFEVAPDGGRVYFGSGDAFYAFDAKGKLVDRLGVARGAAKALFPLPDGWFLAFISHADGGTSIAESPMRRADLRVASGVAVGCFRPGVGPTEGGVS